MGAYLIRLHASVAMVPPVDPARALRARADAVAPIVGFGKASAGPAQHWGMNLLKAVHSRLSEAADVFNFAVLAHPETVVKNAPNVLGEMAVDVGIDGSL